MSADVLTVTANVGIALETLTKALEAAQVDEARLNAECVMAAVIDCPRLDLPRHGSRSMSAPQQARLEGIGSRLLQGEPLQYAMGHTDFMGLRILTDSRALIPRPETEGLVELAVAAGRGRQHTPILAADVGTGSGCIAVALAAHLPHARVQALDISRQALDLAGSNVAGHELGHRISLRQADLLDGVDPDTLDLIVSNPPYVTQAEWEALPARIRLHEPSLALAAGPDGLSVIRRLVLQAHRVLRTGGSLLLEIGSTQGEAVACLLGAAGFQRVSISKDLDGHDRHVKGDA